MKTLGFLKAFSIKFATFVLMLEQTVRDIQPFLVVLAVFLFAFATVFHLRLAGWDHDRFHFHDDGELNPFRSVKDLLMFAETFGRSEATRSDVSSWPVATSRMSRMTS